MTPDMWITLSILVVAITLFITERLRVDVIALGIVIALMLTGILTVDEAIAGFSNSAVLLIAALFIVGGAVFQTGLAAVLARQIIRLAGDSETRLTVVIMAAVALMSGFVSDTGTVAVVMPAIISLGLSTKISPSKLLIPTAFGSLLGGSATLIGTPPNIIVSEVLAENGYEAFGFFSYTGMGIVLIITGILYMLVMRRFIPVRAKAVDEQSVTTPSELIEAYQLPDSIYKLRVRKASSLVGQELGQAGLGRRYGIDVVEISRPAPARKLAAVGGKELVVQSNRNIPVHPHPDVTLEHNDILIVHAIGDAISKASAALNLAIQPKSSDVEDDLISQEVGVAEVVLPPRSSLIGKTVVDLSFGKRHRLTVLNIHRPGSDNLPVRDTKLQFGDTLLVQGEWQDIFRLKQSPNDFVIIGGTEEIQSRLLNFEKAPLVLAILAGMLITLIAGWLPTTTAAMLASLLIILTGCLSMDEAYDAIDWKSIVLIAGMLPMSTALIKVGLVDVAANGFANTLGGLGAIYVMGGLFLFTSIFTQVLSNTATAVIIAPIALATAQSLGVQPQAFLMAVAVAASMAFASPVASPVNTLVMGAGKYRFADYIKLGLPLILLTFIAAMIVLPILFPF
jgi:di/tricarboxylate transporter